MNHPCCTCWHQISHALICRSRCYHRTAAKRSEWKRAMCNCCVGRRIRCLTYDSSSWMHTMSHWHNMPGRLLLLQFGEEWRSCLLVKLPDPRRRTYLLSSRNIAEPGNLSANWRFSLNQSVIIFVIINSVKAAMPEHRIKPGRSALSCGVRKQQALRSYNL